MCVCVCVCVCVCIMIDVRNIEHMYNNYYYVIIYITDTCDRAFNLNEAQYIVWAVGGIEESAFKHFTRAERENYNVCRENIRL